MEGEIGSCPKPISNAVALQPMRPTHLPILLASQISPLLAARNFEPRLRPQDWLQQAFTQLPLPTHSD